MYPYVHEKTDKNAYSSTLCSGSKVDTTQMEVAVEYLNGLQYIHMLENYIANRDEPNATIHNNIILSKRSQPQKKTHSRISLIKISKAVRHHPPNKKSYSKRNLNSGCFRSGKQQQLTGKRDPESLGITEALCILIVLMVPPV